MRDAVAAQFKALAGVAPEFLFSGWGGELTEPERAAHENRLPSEEHHRAWRNEQALADLLAAWLALDANRRGAIVTELQQRGGEQWALGAALARLS